MWRSKPNIDEAKADADPYADKVCNTLRQFGLDVKIVSKLEKPKEYTVVIRISNSPIQEVGFLSHWRDDDEFFDAGWSLEHEFRVPDPCICYRFPNIELGSIRERRFLFFGRNGVSWEGFENLKIKERLNQDSLIAAAIASARWGIASNPTKGCWTIGGPDPFIYEDRKVWTIYEKIANHLLASTKALNTLYEWT
jgi:hypothetical protein